MTDLNGLILDDTYYLFTLQNTLPYLPQNIYLDENGTVAPDPIQFLANGTLPDLYWEEGATYRLEVRQGNSQTDPLIYVWNDYQPLGTEQPIPPENGSISTDNQVANGQFSIVNFVGSFTTSSPGTYNIAPGWQLITEGSGNATVTQATFIGTDWTPDNATNASYGLSITNNGFTTVTLQQTFSGNGALWTGAESLGATGPGVAINFTASASTAVNLGVQINYNSGSVPEDINFLVPITTIMTDYQKSSPILISTSVVVPANASTNLDFVMTNNTTYKITSVQLVAQDFVQDVPYLQTTLQQQQNSTFYYYNPLLQFKPIPSLLTGWDFGLNPNQFGSASISIPTANSAYAWDQTIMQSSQAAVTVTRNASTGGMKVTTGAANEAFYLLQYLTGTEAIQTTLSNLSVNINAYSTIHGSVTVRCYLVNCGLSSGVIPVAAPGQTICTIAGGHGQSYATPDGTISLSQAGWVFIPPLNGFYEPQTLPTANGDVQFVSYAGATNYNADVLGNNFAIIVSFACPTSGTVVNINSISCVPGDIATRPAPQSYDEVLRECEHYYEKSYDTSVIVTPTTGSNTFVNALFFPQQALSGGINILLYPTPFGFQFKEIKRAVPNLYIYSPYTSGTPAANTVYAWIKTNNGSATPAPATILLTVSPATTGYWTLTDPQASASTLGKKGVAFTQQNQTSPIAYLISSGSSSNATGGIYLHYVADSRLGVV